MKSYRFAAILAATAALAACSPKARISGVIEGGEGRNIEIGTDTLSLGKGGRYSISLDVKKGQPEFVYITMDGRRLASIVLQAGDRITASGDTLAISAIAGSEESANLNEIDTDFDAFLASFLSAGSEAEFNKIFIDYYRSRVKYAVSHMHSIAIIPMLTQHLADNVPIFSNATDAVIFRMAADSLKTVYPESRYVKLLDAEARSREQLLGIENALSHAQEIGFPNLIIKDLNGEDVSLASLESKVTLLHFWNVDDPGQKMINLDILLPLYEEFHDKGFDIYAVCVSANKPRWAQVVKEQGLPWINVCDGLGLASGALTLYNVQSLPSTFIISGDELNTDGIAGDPALLRKQIARLLK